ncbi:MAG: peptidylprolyl isomerase [SAR86 cluster bacterium]|uniref:Peptidyl-prolyl cis-trans isomerase n=1 Tax=SAR86 cluster bacterium TaxID=2030880 RepID=A0A2A5CGB7_9GAMM|nr:MAG: peptidylprolyl isomerase [SAR86 cluster bacterium]
MADPLTSIDDRASYAIGRQMGEQLTKNPFDGMQTEAVLSGMADALADKPSPISREDMNEAIDDLNKRMLEKQQEDAGSEEASGEAFLAKNAEREEVETTASGLQYEVIETGEGEMPELSSRVKVHYHGTLTDGTVFDSSVDRGQPIDFPVSGVIAGWTEALQMMNPGAKYKLYIPHQLAYGEAGAGDVIKPFTTLIFDVELLEIL